MKKLFTLLCLVPLLATLLGGCRYIRIEEAPREPLNFTIVNEEEIPKELAALIEEKKAKEFQLTFQEGADMYLVRGYGQQMSGGYSIQVQEVSHSANAVFFVTNILRPSEDSMGSEPSYPYIAVKIKYRDDPVQFE